jgi:hypothetical protein
MSSLIKPAAAAALVIILPGCFMTASRNDGARVRAAAAQDMVVPSSEPDCY